jgi:periplasmic protein TonB
MKALRVAAVVSIVIASLVSLGAQQVYKAGNGVSLPSVVNKVNPQYTEEAKAARIEGIVDLNATVRVDGTVSDVKVTRSLDSTLGLDQQAVKALQQWTFKPGQKDGKDVAVNLDFRINFTLK